MPHCLRWNRSGDKNLAGIDHHNKIAAKLRSAPSWQREGTEPWHCHTEAAGPAFLAAWCARAHLLHCLKRVPATTRAHPQLPRPARWGLSPLRSAQLAANPGSTYCVASNMRLHTGPSSAGRARPSELRGGSCHGYISSSASRGMATVSSCCHPLQPILCCRNPQQPYI